jgi:hypothetical protein
MLKYVAGQKWRVFAFNRTTNSPVTGDAANITAKLSIDYGSRTAVSDTNPTEAEDGYYYFDLTAAETNGNILEIFPESATSGVQVIGIPGRELPTSPANSGGASSDPNYNLFIYSAGQTDLYAFPASNAYPFSGWSTHRVLCTELQPGLYQANIDVNKSTLWSVFDGAAQPTTHDDAIQTLAGGPSTGTGPNEVVITVTLDGDPVENASVRMYRAGASYTWNTDVDGEVIFNLDSATWSVAIAADGGSFAGATLVVDGDETATYALTATSIPASDPGKRTVYYTCIGNNGSISVGASVSATVIQAPGVGLAMMGTTRTVTSDAQGVASFTNCVIGATYEFSMGNGRKVAATIPSGTTPVSLESIVGK